MKSICLYLLTLGLAALLAGCNSISKEVCEGADWHSMGYRAAMRGDRERGSLSDRYRQCDDKHGVQPELNEVRSGYSEGLKYFCTETMGETFGREGGRYQSTCPKEAEKPFLEGYRTGKLDYVNDRVESLESQVRRLRSELSDRDSEIRSLQSRLRSKN